MPEDCCRKLFIFLFFFLFFFPSFSNAQVSRIEFVTDPQVIRPGELSGPITIQAQDSSGNPQQTPETIDLEFVSSSGTGEFLGATGNQATKTMNTNTANRTFYYRDASVGTFTITINATGRSSGQAWSASQVITVSNSAEVINQTASQMSVTTTSSSSSNTTSSSSSSQTSSAHYSAIPLSNTKTSSTVSLGAGRDRVGSVGTPMEFRAETNIKSNRNNIFKWNFGDGTEAGGDVTSHVYEYPGEYVVVLKLLVPEGEAIARAKVRIVDPEIVIVSADQEKIEVKNNANTEISLYGRALSANGKVFPFPQDTIIGSGQRIFFSSKVTKLSPNHFREVEILTVGEGASQMKMLELAEQKRMEKIATLQSELAVLQNQLASMTVPAYQVASVQNIELTNSSAGIEDGAQPQQVASVLESVESLEIEVGWLAKLKRFFLGSK